jgi:hypothetical protein
MRFSDYPLSLILIVSLVAFVASTEIGRRYGLFARRDGRDSVSTLEGSVLGLLALMIGFTFALALSRYETRREAVLNEANSIGTTALRARLLPAPHNTECVKLLKEYVRIRLDVTRSNPSQAEYQSVIDKSNDIQEALWSQAMAVAQKDPGLVPTGVFIQSLNDMIDDQESRLTAIASSVPNVVMSALYGVAIIACIFMGYAAGMEQMHSRLPTYTMIALVATVLLLIQDLDRPRTGFILISQQPMQDVAAATESFPD